MPHRCQQCLVQFWYQISLEEFQININLWFDFPLGGFLGSSSYCVVSKLLDDVVENLREDVLEDAPAVRNLVHDLAEDLGAQEHVEDDLGIVGEDVVLLYHLFVHSLVQCALFRLVLDVFDTLLQICVLFDALQRVVVANEEVVFVSAIQLTFVFCIEFYLLLDFLQLFPFVIVNLFEKELLDFHPGVDADVVRQDVFVCTHGYHG